MANIRIFAQCAGILVAAIGFGACLEERQAPEFQAQSVFEIATGCAGAPDSDRACRAMAARGARVATAANCISCHTVRGGAPYAGGEGIQTPYGVFAGPNITPHAEGVGEIALATFADAVRNGDRPGGGVLFPVMPYDLYSGMTDEDVAALWLHFMRDVAPAPGRPAQTGNAIENARLASASWRAMFFRPASFHADPRMSEAWNRGAYLVEVLGHCRACHVPRNALGVIDRTAGMTGGEVDGFVAPDIGPGSEFAASSPSEIVVLLRTGERDGLAMAGPMARVVADSLSRLPESDLLAMAAYLRAQPKGAARP